jgi:peptidoglycan/xylan/chitin deacetylase (PgdA/CDA1 family)
MILAFYEGYRNGYDVILPLLEKYRLTGWFFVITGFVDASPADQLRYADLHGIDMASREYDDGRYALSWNELMDIDRKHVVASHALSHEELAPMDDAARRAEVLGSQETFLRNLGHPVRTFVSRGGPAYGDHDATDRLIDAAGPASTVIVSSFLGMGSRRSSVRLADAVLEQLEPASPRAELPLTQHGLRALRRRVGSRRSRTAPRRPGRRLAGSRALARARDGDRGAGD